jgi:hypothetical protein
VLAIIGSGTFCPKPYGLDSSCAGAVIFFLEVPAAAEDATSPLAMAMRCGHRRTANGSRAECIVQTRRKGAGLMYFPGD